MSLLKLENETTYRETRLSGLRALRGVVKKIGHEDSNLWDSNHLNKIIPAYLINMQDNLSTNDLEICNEICSVLRETAECGLKELVTVTLFSRANALLHPVLFHFDLNSLWFDGSQFAIYTFVLIIKTMQPQIRYLSIQALLSHLDSKPSCQHKIKRGILEVLSSCVGVATDGSIGPSVLDVFRTLIKHLHNSIEESQEHEQDKIFHEKIVRIVGEFAAVLPDYHNPDIMNLIFSYLPFEGDGNIKSISTCNEKEAELISLLVKCLLVVADSSHPTVIDVTLPESLLISLSQLMDIQRPDVQLNVMYLWQKMIDHNENKNNVSVNMNFSTFKETGLVLGNAPIRFRHQARKLFFPKLLNLVAGDKFQAIEHAKAFHALLILVTMEFLTAGISDILILMVELENIASELSVAHCNFIHACVADCLSLVAVVCEDGDLASHLKSVISKRSDMGTGLLMPAGLTHITRDFDVEIVSYGELQEGLLFNLIPKGFVSHPADVSRNSSTYPVVADHSRSFRSYFENHTEDSAQNVFTFDKLKEETESTYSNSKRALPNTVENAPTFHEMMTYVEVHDSTSKEDIDHILKSALTMEEDETPNDLDLKFL